MSRTAPQLWEFYNEWKRLTELEGGAILSSNWAEVGRCQRDKEHLRDRIVKITDSVKADCASPLQHDELNAQIRRHVNELIQLEAENHCTLGRRMATLETERAALEETSNRLKKVHQSYVPAAPPIWNQYS
jgi:hypothetical protein